MPPYHNVSTEIWSILQLSISVLIKLNSMKYPSDDAHRCTIGIHNTCKLLHAQESRLNKTSSNDAWFTEVQALAAINEPLDQYRSALEQLQSKIELSYFTVTARAVWLGELDEEISNTLLTIERLKPLTEIALEMDHL